MCVFPQIITYFTEKSNYKEEGGGGGGGQWSECDILQYYYFALCSTVLVFISSMVFTCYATFPPPPPPPKRQISYYYPHFTVLCLLLSGQCSNIQKNLILNYINTYSTINQARHFSSPLKLIKPPFPKFLITSFRSLHNFDACLNFKLDLTSLTPAIAI